MPRFVGIDPATNTGFVAIDEKANVLVAESVKGNGPKVKGGITVEQLVSLENQVFKLLKPKDEIVIEDTAFGTQNGVSTGMIHGGIRSMIHRKGLGFNLVNPTDTKKFVAVTGWTGEPGNKRRLKDKEKKEAMAAAVKEHFGFTHKSHDVVDAYIIARISLNLYRCREFMPMIDTLPYQLEVIEKILGKRDVIGK